MLGFSLSKLVVLLLIIAVVWYGFRFLSRRGQSVGRQQDRDRIGRKAADEDRTTVHDMETCSVCGTFVPATAARACGRDGCPYPP